MGEKIFDLDDPRSFGQRAGKPIVPGSRYQDYDWLSPSYSVEFSLTQYCKSVSFCGNGNEVLQPRKIL